MCSGFVVSVRAHVAAGCARMYLSENCAQLAQSNSDGPFGQRPPAHAPEVAAVHERTVDQDAHPEVPGERQDAILRARLHHRVVHLNEVEGLRPHERLELIVPSGAGDGDANVARLSRVLPPEHVGPVHVQISHALDLQEIQGAASDQLLVLPHLCDAGRFPVRVDLRGYEEPAAELRRRQNLAELGVDLRSARRGVDDPPPVLEEHSDHGRHGLRPLGRDLEHGLRGPQAHDGQRLFGSGYRACREHGLGR